MDDFNFKEWITKFKLNDIEECFVDHDMTNLNTLNMNNRNLSKLMSDKRILSKPDLIEHIVNGIQSLCKNEWTTERRLIFMTQKEKNIFFNIEKYIDNLNKLQNEFEITINDNIKNRKEINNSMINEYATKHKGKLNKIGIEINETMNKLHDILSQNEEIIENRMNGYKEKVKEIKIRHNSNMKNINNTIETCLSIIDKDVQYFQDSIKKCTDIVNKYDDELDEHKNDKQYTFKQKNYKNRENEIQKIGNNATNYYNKNLIILNDNRYKINEYIENELILNLNQIYSLQINNNIYNKICNNINNKLIKLKNDGVDHQDDEEQEDQIQIVHNSHSNKTEKKQIQQNNMVIIQQQQKKEESPPIAFAQNFQIANDEKQNEIEISLELEMDEPPPPPYNPIARSATKKQIMSKHQSIPSPKNQSVSPKTNVSISISEERMPKKEKHQTQDSIIMDGVISNQHKLYEEAIANNNSKSNIKPQAFAKYWCCTVCTFKENPGTYLMCDVCGSSRQLSMPLSRQHSLSDPPLMIPQSKSELQFRSHSDSTGAKEEYNIVVSSVDDVKQTKVIRAVSASHVKKNNNTKKSKLFSWNKRKSNKKGGNNKKKVQDQK